MLVRVGVEIDLNGPRAHSISALAKGFAAAVKKEKFGCTESHTGPDCCKLAPEDGRVQQKYRGIYAPLPPVDTPLWPLLMLAWRLFTFDGGLGHAVDKFAQLSLGQRADFGVDRITAFKHD